MLNEVMECQIGHTGRSVVDLNKRTIAVTEPQKDNIPLGSSNSFIEREKINKETTVINKFH